MNKLLPENHPRRDVDTTLTITITGGRQEGKSLLARRIQKLLVDAGVENVRYHTISGGEEAVRRVEKNYPLDKVEKLFDGKRCNDIRIVEII